MKIADQQHPFYKPLWRRIAIVVVVALWLAFELWMGSTGIWLAMAGGMLAYAIWVFLISFPKDDGGPPA